MQAAERLLEIEEAFGNKLDRIVPLELDDETLRLVLYLGDGTNLWLAEQWQGRTLRRYSYDCLTPTNELKIGWDNAPHHTRLASFPHHKHVGQRDNLQPSLETCMEEVMAIVLSSS